MTGSGPDTRITTSPALTGEPSGTPIGDLDLRVDPQEDQGGHAEARHHPRLTSREDPGARGLGRDRRDTRHVDRVAGQVLLEGSVDGGEHGVGVEPGRRQLLQQRPEGADVGAHAGTSSGTTSVGAEGRNAPSGTPAASHQSW